MKKILTLLIAASSAVSAIAQQVPADRKYATDADLSRWVIDLNLLGGMATEDITTAPSATNYPNALNMNTGQLKFNNGYSFGGDAQLGFFFGKKRHFGVGTGIMFMSQHGDASLNSYHVEYQATDGAGNIFRQVVDGNGIKEDIRSSIINIPIVLKYKNRFSKHWGFTADAGALINVQMNNRYTTHASFDYGAIYKFAPGGGDVGTISVYDNSPVPSSNDWLITKAEFLRNNSNGNLEDYFAKKRALGYSVGDGMSPRTTSGHTSYNNASVGLLLQPSLNYFLSDHVALNLGVYYMWQPFKNNAQNGYELTNGIGKYSSVLNNVTASTNQAYGLNIGVRFFLGKKSAPMIIGAVEQSSPSQCGLCDGGIAFHGLPPNQSAKVDYSLNGAQPTQYITTVQPDGQVKMDNLCAGNYTGIKITIKKRSADGKPVTLIDPVLSVSSENVVNPTLAGRCDGLVKFGGLYAGKTVAINYNMDGIAQSPFTGTVNPDKSITMTGLCSGAYTGIIITCNTCTAKSKNFTLTAPAPVVADKPADDGDINSTVLFEFDKSVIRSTYYPTLDKTIKEMKEDEYIYIKIDGHTDIIGTESYNQKLSERRALAVKEYFINKGVSPDRIKMRAYGDDDPIATNKTANGRMLNRRVLLITNKK